MEYIIVHKELRPAGDWLITAESEEGGFFHGSFASEPTASQVNEKAKIKAAQYLEAKELRAKEEEAALARIAEEEAEE